MKIVLVVDYDIRWGEVGEEENCSFFYLYVVENDLLVVVAKPPALCLL